MASSLLVSAASAQDKSDKDKLQGTWLMVSGERAGKALPPEFAKDAKVVFAGDKLTLKNKDFMLEGTFKLDPGKKPKEIDVDFNGKPGKGIYQLEGDTLKIAHGETGDPRPKDFTTKEGDQVTVVVFKREKAEKEGRKIERLVRGRDVTDFLPLLDVKDKSKLIEGQKEILQKLENSKVPTREKATEIAHGYKFKASGILAEEAAHVVSLLPLGIDVADFANRGDLIWVVQFRVFHGSITQEVWISTSTGAALGMLPLKR
jgi:uncharacterized protein (TIGR03067 family)